MSETQPKPGIRRFTVLGCGSSPGVPRIGGDWGNCDPNNPRNQRRRASLMVEQFGVDGVTRIIIDTGPDFRDQMISENVDRADAILYTHAHADHLHGIDDLRSFVINSRQRVSVWMDERTSIRVHEAFDYCFTTPKGSSYPPILHENRIKAGQAFEILGDGGAIEVMPFEQLHGSIVSLGFKFDQVAYSSDVSDLDERALQHLDSLDVWFVDALQYREHPSHLSLDQALGWIEKLNPKRAILTHMHTPLDYETVRKETPDHVEPAYDGMNLDI